jgi:hypothetical protein
VIADGEAANVFKMIQRVCGSAVSLKTKEGKFSHPNLLHEKASTTPSKSTNY